MVQLFKWPLQDHEKSKLDIDRKAKAFPRIGFIGLLFDDSDDAMPVIKGPCDCGIFFAREISQAFSAPPDANRVVVMGVVGFSDQFEPVTDPDGWIELVEPVILTTSKGRALDQHPDAAVFVLFGGQRLTGQRKEQ